MTDLSTTSLTLPAAKEILNAAGLSLSDISALIGGKTDEA